MLAAGFAGLTHFVVSAARHVFFWEYRKLSLPFEEGQSFFCLCLGIPDHSIIPGTLWPLGWMKEIRDQLKPFDWRGASSVGIPKMKCGIPYSKYRTKAKL